MLDIENGIAVPPWVKWPYCLAVNNPIPEDGMGPYAQEYMEFLSRNQNIQQPIFSALGGKFVLPTSSKLDIFSLWSWTDDGTPKYNRESVKNMRVLGFYGHDVDPDGKITSTCMSNWYPAKFRILDMEFNCNEQFMMACKAMLFKDDDSLEAIMAQTSPAVMKKLGRRVSNFDAELWDRLSYTLVLNGAWAKFSQNIELAKYLLSTDGKAIAEASPRDKLWGIGMSTTNARVQIPLQWNGANKLGFALMEVRDELKAVGAPYV